MPGHDEETIRKAREDEEATNNPAMGDTGLGGTGRTGDIGAGGAGGAFGEGLETALTGEDPGDLGTSGVRGSGTFDPNDDVGRPQGRTGADVQGSGGGSGTFDPDDDLGGIGGTGMTNAEQGSGAQNRMTTGIGAAGDQTDEDLLEGR
jgi:hypothetical protein